MGADSTYRGTKTHFTPVNAMQIDLLAVLEFGTPLFAAGRPFFVEKNGQIDVRQDRN
jgi:hypothetical protein